MSNVQEALKSIELAEETGNIQYLLDALNDCKAALEALEKCEPVAEALHERNRLGYAVVDVIGALDEIIENAQEVEVDDFLHIAIPIDKWHELQDALEEMPKRAELYTSPQPIDKCAPVYLIVSGADEIVVTKEKYDSWTSAKRISYTSPISKECAPVGWYCKACKETGLTHCSDPVNCGGMVRTYTSPISRDWVGLTYKNKVDLRENTDWYNFPNDLIEATEAKLKQLNAGKG